MSGKATYRELAHALENVIPEGHKGEPLTKPKKQNPRKLPSWGLLGHLTEELVTAGVGLVDADLQAAPANPASEINNSFPAAATAPSPFGRQHPSSNAFGPRADPAG